MAWTEIYRDTNQTVEQDETGAQRITYANPNENTIRQRAAQALAANRAYLDLPTPTAAQQRTHLAALTRQNQGLLRFLLDDLDGTD